MGFYFYNYLYVRYIIMNIITEMYIGETMYIIEHSQCDAAKESVESKLTRIIFREIEHHIKHPDENHQLN